jgi:SAM-dependent methyltransferase
VRAQPVSTMREHPNASPTRSTRRLHPGESTAVPSNVAYRLSKLEKRGVIAGRWLDCGCADGGYSIGLAERGAARVTGVDVMPERIDEARKRASGSANLHFGVYESERLPFGDSTFDGVLLNEVLEHVVDERQTLAEIFRVLKPGGHLALFSPNRWFPFEGHGMAIRGRSLKFPVPWIPWLPKALTRRYLLARNYWPGDLRRLVKQAGFRIDEQSSVFPVLEVYPWLPKAAIRTFRRLVPFLERVPIIRRFGVSNFILARRQ